MDQTKVPTLRQLYPEATDEQLAEAEKTLQNYVAVIASIFERIHAEYGADAASRLARGDLTFLGNGANVQGERSNPLTNPPIQT